MNIIMNTMPYIHKCMRAAMAAACTIVALSACSDMMDTDSELVEFENDNTISAPKDTIYNVMGIIYTLQNVADRTVLLGELRADLVTVTSAATTDIKQLAAGEADADNPYNQISDYYAVINNCNNYLAKADTTLSKYGNYVFTKEYAVVKTYRAWTYLQLAKIYGSIPLITEPIYTASAAEEEMQKQRSDITDICNYFISDISPYVDTELPNYGTMDNVASTKFFIPVRVLLGEMCLWAGRYTEAAQYLYDYLANKTSPVTTGTSKVAWSVDNNDFLNGYVSVSTIYSSPSLSSSETLAGIPMEDNEFEGVTSYLDDVFSSTENNKYYYQATPSTALRQLSASVPYCHVTQTSVTQIDTTYAPTGIYSDALLNGDLRLYGSYRSYSENRSETSRYSSDMQDLRKVTGDFLQFYRRQQVYLLLAEALCRAGFPESAFCILKYGLTDTNISRYVSQRERDAAGTLLSWDDDVFTSDNTSGIHSNGAGYADCDTLFVLPQPTSALASYSDTVEYQIPLVEDIIINEMALETAFEGYRYYDLMRIAMRRNDPSYLALPIAQRSGETDNDLYTRLMDTNNWYLPIE